MGKPLPAVNNNTTAAVAETEQSSSSSTNANPLPTSTEAPTGLDVFPPSQSRPASVHSQPPPPYIHPRDSRVAARVTNTAGTVRQRRDSRRTGILFRTLSLVCDLLAVALFSACLIRSYSIYTDGYAGTISAMGLGGTCYALLTTFVILTSDLILLYQSKPAMHPAIPLTFDLLAWTGVLAITIVLALFTLDGYGSCYYSDNDSTSYREECEVRNFLQGAERAAIAFSFLGVVFHFCFFVRACKHVHEQRKEIKEMKATLRAYVEMT